MDLYLKVIQIPIDLIDEDLNQPRNCFDETALNELSENIMKLGLLSPIKLKLQDNGRYKIIFGNRRFKACKALNMAEIPAIISENEDDSDLYLEQLAENLQRENFTPLEEAEAFYKLIEFDKKPVIHVSTKLGKTPQYISKKLELLTFGDDVRKLIVSAKGTVKNQLSEEQVIPLINVPSHFKDKLARKIASEEIMPTDVKKIKELFTATDDEIDPATKSRYLVTSKEKLLNDFNDLVKDRTERKKQQENKFNPVAVDKAFVPNTKDPDAMYYKLPIHNKLQKLFMQIPGERSLSGSVLRELNTMKLEERTEFLETIDLLIENLDGHLEYWTNVKKELAKANIKLVK